MLPFRSPLDWRQPVRIGRADGDGPPGRRLRPCAMHLRHAGARPAAAARRRSPAAHRNPVQPRAPVRRPPVSAISRSTVTPNAKAAVNFDLCVNVIESAAGLRIDCDYSTRPVRRGDDRPLDGALPAGAGRHRRRTRDAAVGAAELLSAEQARFVLDAVNDTAAAYPPRAASTTCSRLQAARTPGQRGLQSTARDR